MISSSLDLLGISDQVSIISIKMPQLVIIATAITIKLYSKIIRYQYWAANISRHYYNTVILPSPTDTNALVCKHYLQKQQVIAIQFYNQLLNAFASLFTKIETEMLATYLLAFHMALIKSLWLLVNISLWFITHSIVLLMLFTGFFQSIYVLY